MSKIIVGIDFGTSTTTVRWRKEDSDEVNAIEDKNGSRYIDSAIYIPADNGKWLFGCEALAQNRKGGNLVRNFKMDIINPDPKVKEEAEEYVAKFMQYVYTLFAGQTADVDYDSMDIYISFPVKWREENRSMMVRLVSEAGFGTHGVVLGKPEPVAAASELMRFHIPYLKSGGLLEPNIPRNVIMLDMGAGTSDLFMFQFTMQVNGEIRIPEEKIVQYPVHEESYNCGGREIDEIISKDVRSYLQKGTEIIINEQFFDTKNAKDWKDSMLSDTLKEKKVAETPSYVNKYIDYLINEGKWDKCIQDYKMSRNDFESKTSNHWTNLYKMIENGMAIFKKECKISSEDIDLILITGGHSQWYCIPKLFNGEGINGTIAIHSDKCNSLNFSKIKDEQWRILQGNDPQESVANGLCWPGVLNIPSFSAKEVWVRFGVGNEYTPYIHVINKKELLPKIVSIGKDTDWSKINYQWDTEPYYESDDEDYDEDYDEEDDVDDSDFNYESLYSIAIKKYAISPLLDPDVFKLHVEIYEGEELSDAMISRYEIVHDEQSHLPFLFKLLLESSFFLIPLMKTKKISFSTKIGLADDQRLIVDGSIFVDGKKIYEFNNKDLK